jgi:hypothetical protein
MLDQNRALPHKKTLIIVVGISFEAALFKIILR